MSTGLRTRAACASFVRQAKTLGFSLDEIRDLLRVAERGRCSEVVPRSSACWTKIAAIDVQLADLGTFRERLVAFRAGRDSSGCGCSGHGAFCGCLNDADDPTPVDNEPRSVAK